MGHLQRIVFFLLVVCHTIADVKPSCTPLAPKKTDIPKPAIASQFSVHMEMIDVLEKSVTEITEYYDGPGQRATVFISENAGKRKQYYRYDQQIFLEASEDIDLCISVPISEGDHFLGLKEKNGSRKILSPSAALRFSEPGQVENYMGKAVIRGINTDHWYSCLHLNDPKADLTVNWYFSAADEWETAGEVAQVPVRRHINGTFYETPTVMHHVEHYSEFYHFRTGLPKDITVFDTPRGLLCNGGINPKDPPKIPDIMSFRLEHIDTQDDSVTYSDEVYDFLSGITKHVYKSPVFFTYNLNPLTVINDFNTGVSYNIDMTLGNCTVRPISQLPTDVQKVDTRHVRMTNPQEFFQLKNHFYQGIRTTRNIECDVWIGKKFDKFNTSYITEWYFARSSVVEGDTTTAHTLVQYAEYGVNELTPSFYSNLFDFTQDEPDILQFDISRCYINKGREKFELYFDKKYAAHIMTSVHKFTLDLVTFLAIDLHITPLRIQNVQIHQMMVGVVASFEIVDVAPLTGDVEHPIKETSLAKAASELHKKLKDQKLEILLQYYDKMISLYPTEFTFNSPTSKPPERYNGGAMFAVALAMTCIGIAISALITFKIKAR